MPAQHDVVMIATVTLNPSLDEWVELPSLRVGSLNRAGGFVRYPGGKGINVSRVVHELGGATVAFALAGGEDGHILRALIARLSIREVFVSIPGSTRNNYKILTRHPPALTEINTEGPRVTAAILRTLARRLFAWHPHPQRVVLSGSLPPGAPRHLYQQWIRRLHDRGIPTVLDASGAALRQGLSARPWLVKPNRQEAEELLGRRLVNVSQVARATQELVQRGVHCAVLSLGPDGAVLASASPDGQALTWHARPPAVKVNSAVGAGDALVGGFLVGWQRQRDVVEALRLGVACGAATAMTPGTELCHRADVRKLLARVRIRRLT